MRRDFGFWILDFGLGVVLVTGVLVLAAGVVLAQGGYQVARSGHDLSWWTADGGGQTFSSGPGYSLGGTVGQADAGVMNGPGYSLGGGFWCGGAVAGSMYAVYVPLVLRQYP